MACAVATSAGADEYSIEVSGSAQRLDAGVYEAALSALSVAYYFGAVDDSLGPLELAPFLDRGNRVQVGIDNAEDTQNVTYEFLSGIMAFDVFDNDTDSFSVSGRYVFPTSGWHVEAKARNAETDRHATVFYDSGTTDRATYGLTIGKYIQQYTSVSLDLVSTNSETRVLTQESCALRFFCPATILTDTRTRGVGFSLHRFGRIGGLGYSVSGRTYRRHASIDRSTFTSPLAQPVTPWSDSRPGLDLTNPIGDIELPYSMTTWRYNAYGVSGELFPTSRFGVGLGYTRYDGDPYLDDGYELTARWFFTERLALAAAWVETGRQAASAEFRDADLASLSVTARF